MKIIAGILDAQSGCAVVAPPSGPILAQTKTVAQPLPFQK
jgi:hypothetical protein